MREHIEWFKSYSQEFLNRADEKDIPGIQMKIDHTLRVLKQARLICRTTHPGKELTYLCELAALYHDLGRFPQYSRYKTMSDAISVNHALLSFKTLRRTKRLKDLSPKNRRLVLRAVFMHNRPELPRGLPPDLNYLARVLRDADKLDIMPVVIGMLKKAENNHGIPYLNLPSNPQKYSPGVVELLRQRKRPHISEAHWSNDYVLFICGWIYDMNFRTTWRLVAKRGFLGVLFNMLPQTPDILSLGEQITGDLSLLAQGGKKPWKS